MFTSVFLGVAACGQLVRVSLVSGPSSVLIHSYRRNGVSDGIIIFAIIFAIVSHDERREKSWVGKISIPGEPKKKKELSERLHNEGDRHLSRTACFSS